MRVESLRVRVKKYIAFIFEEITIKDMLNIIDCVTVSIQMLYGKKNVLNIFCECDCGKKI
jgi:hypothetical protein